MLQYDNTISFIYSNVLINNMKSTIEIRESIIYQLYIRKGYTIDEIKEIMNISKIGITDILEKSGVRLC